MLNITEDKTRERGKGQFFVELTSNRGLDIVNCDRLGYWCDKPHLKHMLEGIGKAFTQDELKDLLNIKGEQYQPKDGDIVKIVDFGGTEYEAIFKRRDSNNDIHTYVYSCIPCSDDGRAIDGGMFNSNAVITPSEGSDLFTKMERDGCRWNAEKKELEKIPEPLKEGDLVIAWDRSPGRAIVGVYVEFDEKSDLYKHTLNTNTGYINAIKFESKEQYEKIRRANND